ncbi:hypothetical protein EB822_10650 [Flavobacteriaceae bacterium PRS1]|nr:hypothetical protein EB822_10650 [Flavobacteriaceae bacterium PRS1]
MSIFKKILNKFYKETLVYFYYTGRPKKFNPISYRRRKRELLAKKEIKKIDDGELYAFLQDTTQKSKSTGCEYSDYLTIWEDLNKKKPKNILECGSGISSVVFAYYVSKVKDPKDVTFVSMESIAFWHNQILKIFPEKLKKYVQFNLSERVETLYNGVLGSHYKVIPKLNYDFIFIDGPGLRKVFGDKNYPKCFNSDIINILINNSSKNISGLLDQRIDTLWNLKKLIPNGNIKYNPIKKVAYLKNIRKSQLRKGLKIEETEN